MMQKLTSLDSCMEFIHGIKDDPVYSDPMFVTPETMKSNLFDAVQSDYKSVFGVYRDEELIGLFSFMIEEDDRYLEMLVGFSREDDAYEEMADYLQENFPGYSADFVFNPRNEKIRAMLKKRGAAFDPEMQKMLLTDDTFEGNTDGIEELSGRYHDQYIAIHSKDVYWTAERIIADGRIFRVLLAIDHGTVVGYIDVTKVHDENEIFDFLVKEEYRCRGWGRKLLGKAIEANRPKELLLFVEVDNVPALSLYRSMGFTVVEGNNSVTASWMIPGCAE